MTLIFSNFILPCPFSAHRNGLITHICDAQKVRPNKNEEADVSHKKEMLLSKVTLYT